MKTIFKFSVIIFLFSSFTTPSFLLNREWVLFKIRKERPHQLILVDEHHYLKFDKEKVYFNIDCNACSDSFKIVAEDRIYFSRSALCTRKGCLERDKIKISYD